MSQDELVKLRECVEAGELEQAAFWKVWEPEDDNGYLAYVAKRAAYGSLDAAKELHDALLPDCRWLVEADGNASIYPPNEDLLKAVDCDGATSPACAWLIAILSALSEGEA